MSLSLWGNDTTTHLVEDQTRAGQGAIIPDLSFSLILELVIGSVFLTGNRHAMAQTPQLQQHTQHLSEMPRGKHACCA